jgi:hypothetical protein
VTSSASADKPVWIDTNAYWMPFLFVLVCSVFISFTPFCVGVTDYAAKQICCNNYFLSVVFLHIPQLECGHGINSHYQGKGQGSQNHHVCRVR